VVNSSTPILVNSSEPFDNQDQEDEADWLGSALLLPRPALFHIRQCRWDDERASDHFSVSGDMLRWRFRMTGVDQQLQNYARR